MVPSAGKFMAYQHRPSLAMTPDAPKLGYRRPTLPSAPVIDVAPYRVPKAKRSLWPILLVLGLLGGVGWAWRNDALALAAVIRQSYRQAFPESNRPAGLATTLRKEVESQVPALPTGPRFTSMAVVKEPPAPLPAGGPRLELKSSGPPAGDAWPSFVSVRGTPQVSVVTEDSEARKFVYRTENYEFQADVPIGADAVREFSRVFEATFLANCLLPLNYRPSPEEGRERFVARLFATDQSYLAAGGIRGSSGSYSRNQAAMLAPVSAIGMKMVDGRMQTDRTEATETLVHEITHQMMSRWLERVPVWFAEGSADYMAMADYVHGRFALNQMDVRLRQYLKRRQPETSVPALVTTPELLAMLPAAWTSNFSPKSPIPGENYSSATLLVYFFYHLDGKGDAAAVKAYLRAVEEGVPEKVATEKHLFSGRTVEELEADVLNAYARQGIKLRLTSRGGKRWEPTRAATTPASAGRR